ncbi:bifunctional hydroxymethylpyrimidine kinase/phosphomethylpyrimidine kinase [bacterium]|nr:bifunctional hydroxymethylpyrimidine kinase/phosphomethylpyrimidine kinase [bacterium]
MKTAKALTIAGSDSGGGAGIQADLKTFSALGVYGTSVITSITAQNTVAVTGIQDIELSIIEKQIDAVMSDIGTHAIKTGMLSTAEIIDVVSRGLTKFNARKLVVDPVMVAKSGHKLLQDNAVHALVHKLIPMAQVVTPNIPEAEVLTGEKINSLDDMEKACRRLLEMGCRAVVVKGGHSKKDAVDVFYDGKKIHHMSSKRYRTKNTHGTGCTFSAAIAAYLAKGYPTLEAVKFSKKYITGAIAHSYSIGKGHGPVHHFYKFY